MLCSTRSRAVEKKPFKMFFNWKKNVFFFVSHCALNFLAVLIESLSAFEYNVPSIFKTPSHCLWLHCEKPEKALCGMTNLNEARRVMQCFDTGEIEKGLIALSLAFWWTITKIKERNAWVLRSLISSIYDYFYMHSQVPELIWFFPFF